MKTKIITLESHDDLISVRDKLSWAKTPRILLIVPKYEKISLRVLDLKVLQRHADSLGAQLGLVTRRMKIRRDAESLGIPVFKSTTMAQRKDWGQSAPRKQFIPPAPRRDLRELRDAARQKESAWRTSLMGRIVAFTFGVAAVLAIAILFAPRARVTVYPETLNQSAVIPIRASETNAAVSITGEIPARKLSANVGAKQTLAITTKISIPKSKAQGIARFTNLSRGEINIPAGTLVATADEPRARFITLHDTLLGAGNKFVDVPIESYEAGANGNVEAGAITTVEGLLGLSLTATNPNPISGGADVQKIGADDRDRARLRESALETLRRDAETKMRAQIKSNDILLMDTLEVANIAEETFTPDAGQPGASLTLTMQAEFSARYISAADLNQLARAALSSSTPIGFTAQDEATFKMRGSPKTDSTGATHFEIEAARKLVKQANVMQVFSIARGREPAAAKVELTKNLSLRQPPEIALSPSWWKWMPLIPFNISVEVK
ncbi:MAG: baseplate J/gp47 family protein [Anaerolineales bacterium]|nr:baseplate J/gp47 family protein [Anaerolineales bacterium]